MSPELASQAASIDTGLKLGDPRLSVLAKASEMEFTRLTQEPVSLLPTEIAPKSLKQKFLDIASGVGKRFTRLGIVVGQIGPNAALAMQFFTQVATPASSAYAETINAPDNFSNSTNTEAIVPASETHKISQFKAALDGGDGSDGDDPDKNKEPEVAGVNSAPLVDSSSVLTIDSLPSISNSNMDGYIQDGRYIVDIKDETWTGSPSVRIPGTYSNASFSIDGTLSGAIGRVLGFDLRKQEGSNSSYRLQGNPATGIIRVLVMENGKPTSTIIDVKRPDLFKNGQFNLEYGAFGNTVFLADPKTGNLIASADDATYPEGYMDFGMGGTAGKASLDVSGFQAKLIDAVPNNSVNVTPKVENKPSTPEGGTKLQQLAAIYESIGDQELTDEMNAYLNLTPDDLKMITDYGLPAIRINKDLTDEAAIFTFSHDFLLVQKYLDLIKSLPSSAFADTGALKSWLNTDETKFKLDIDVYDQVARSYDRTSPKINTLGIAHSSIFTELYKEWDFYQNYVLKNPPRSEPKESLWLRVINVLFYDHKIKNLDPNNDMVFAGPNGVARFLKPLEIPWK